MCPALPPTGSGPQSRFHGSQGTDGPGLSDGTVRSSSGRRPHPVRGFETLDRTVTPELRSTDPPATGPSTPTCGLLEGVSTTVSTQGSKGPDLVSTGTLVSRGRGPVGVSVGGAGTIRGAPFLG